jgi:hypothetical protein
LAESGLMFGAGNEIVNFTMGGIPRDCLPSEWNVERLFYLFFNAQSAYSINYIILHIIAFLGMRLFIRKYITQEPSILNIVSLTFAMLPFWPSGGLSVAGLPLLTFALLNIFLSKSNKWDWIIIVLFPLYSSLAVGNLFSFPILFMFYILGVIFRKWKISFLNILPFVLLLSINIFVEHRLIGLLLSDFESNRVADITNKYTFLNFKGILGTSILAFFFGHYHFHSLHLFIFIVSFFIIAISGLKNRALSSNLKSSFILMILIGVFSFITIFLNNYDVKRLFGAWFPKVNLRFWVIYPFVTYLVFAFVLKHLTEIKRNKWVKSLLLLQLIIVMFLIYPKDYHGSRYAENILANTLINNNDESTKWREYYREEEFEALKNSMPYITNYYIVTLGLSPEILQYNRFKTLEGYYPFYPLEKFNLISRIDKTINNESHFIYSNLNKLKYNNKNEIPDWDYSLLCNNHVKYVFSSFEIDSIKPKYRSESMWIYEINSLVRALKVNKH